MPVVTLGSTWTRPDNYFSQPNGAYRVTLQRIGADTDGVFVDGGSYEHRSEMFGLKVKQSWRFTLDNGEIIDAGVAMAKNGKISENSTIYKYATALVGHPPQKGQPFDYMACIGLSALAFIQRDDNDIPRITALSVLEGAQVSPVQPVAAAPAQPAAAPQTTPDALPF